MRYLITILLIALCSSFAGAQQSSEYLPQQVDEFIQINWEPRVLAPVFRPEKTYRFTTETDLQIATAGEINRQILIQQQMRFDTKSRQNKAAGVTVRSITERLRFTINNDAGQSLKYDSLKKPETKLDHHFHSTIRRNVHMELDGEMRILSQRRSGKRVEGQSMPGVPVVGPDELLQVIRLIPQGFSKEPVAIGQYWTKTGKQPMGELGELNFNISHKLVGFIKHQKITCAVIEFQGQMSGDITTEDESHLNFQSAQLLGRILFDPGLRVVRHSETTVTMTVNTPDPDEPSTTKQVSIRQNAILNFLSVK